MSASVVDVRFDWSSLDCIGCISDYGFCAVGHVRSELSEQAHTLATSLLGDLPNRLSHSLAVGSAAAALALNRGGSLKFVDICRAVGILHDVGYSERVPTAGVVRQHAFDGAAWMRALDFPEDVVRHVAYHSTSRWECNRMGLDLSIFGTPPEDTLADILWVADFTTDALGHPISIDGRLADIRVRHASNLAIIGALDDATATLKRTINRLGVHNPLDATRAS